MAVFFFFRIAMDRYGNASAPHSNEGQEVTQAVQAQVNAGNHAIPVENGLFGDPAHGHLKTMYCDFVRLFCFASFASEMVVIVTEGVACLLRHSSLTRSRGFCGDIRAGGADFGAGQRARDDRP